MAGFKTNDPDRHAKQLRQRFSRVTAKSLPSSRYAFGQLWKVFAAVALVSFAIAGMHYTANARGWEASTLLLHIAAAPDCAHANAVGLAPAHSNAPSYYDRHDRDNDGWACEGYL